MKQLFNLSVLSRNKNSKAHDAMLQTTWQTSTGGVTRWVTRMYG